MSAIKERTSPTEAPVVVERTFNVPANLVWNAITDYDQMKQWYIEGQPNRSSLSVGFETEFTITSRGQRISSHLESHRSCPGKEDHL